MDFEEYDSFIKANNKLSQKTKTTYQHTWSKLSNELTKSISKSNQKDVVDAAAKLSNTPNTEAQLISVAIQIRRHHNVPVNLLMNARDRVRVRIEERKERVNAAKADDLPTLATLKKHMNQQYTDGKWRDFVILYLLVTFSTRNKDLDVEIIDKKLSATDPEGNYVLLRPGGSLSYIRRNYKTASIYGAKQALFKSKKVVHAIKEIVKEAGGFEDDKPIYLLTTGKGNRIGEDSIQKYIRARTYKGLSESDYNRVAVSAVDSVQDWSALRRISVNRGTSINTLVSEYHLSYPLNGEAK